MARADTSPNLFLWGGGFPAFLDVSAVAVRLVGGGRCSQMVLSPEHRASMRKQAQPYRSRSLSPRAPYLWQDRDEDVSSTERRSRKGWYRVDYGPNKSEEVWYLPNFKDRMNFLERSVDRATSEPRSLVRASSVPPSRTGALSIDPLVRYPYRWRTWPFYYYNYRRPYSTYYDMYWPTLGHSGRIWRLPWYRYPSSPLTVSTAWRYVSSRGRQEDNSTTTLVSTSVLLHPLPVGPARPASSTPAPSASNLTIHATPRLRQPPHSSVGKRRHPLLYRRHVPAGSYVPEKIVSATLLIRATPPSVLSPYLSRRFRHPLSPI